MTGWRWQPKTAVAVTAAVLALQTLIPTVALLGERSHTGRFGWQMYSLSVEAFDYTVFTESDSHVVGVGQVMAIPRADLPLEELIPPHLCRTVEGAVRVVWEGGDLEC